jgi:tetratricopeptide (TPR) repeat protein
VGRVGHVGRVGLIPFIILFWSLTAAAQRDPRTAMLEQDGWALIAAGRAAAAADVFRQAIAGDPKNARLHLGAATAAFLDRRDDDARAEAQRALALDPALTAARALVGQVQHRTGDLTGAIRTFEALAETAPDNRDAVATLARWRRELDLQNRMQQAIGAHFTISFQGPAEAQLAAEALDSLDRAYWRIGAVLGTYATDPISVVLYTAEQFSDVTRSPAWAAAAYDGVVRVPMRGALQNRSELDRVLAHEFVHALVRTLAPHGVPTWLNEGLATALETGDAGPAERAAASAARRPALARLAGSFRAFNDADAELAYGVSALAVRRLLDEAGGTAIANLLRDLGDDVPFETAFQHRIQRSFAEFASTLE